VLPIILGGKKEVMRYDIAVVGAGPAGTTVARLLAKKNLKVVLLEKKSFPRDKPCGGMLSPRVLERFADLKNEIKESLVSTSFGVHLYSPSLKIQLQHFTVDPMDYMILRREFDHLMSQVAVDCGAELITKKVIDLTIKSDSVRVLLEDNTTIESKVLIGADGVNSIVAKKMELSSTSFYKNLAVCAVAEVEVDQKAVEVAVGEQNPIHLFLGFDNLIGFGWLLPKKTHINIGLGGLLTQQTHIRKRFLNFVQTLKKMNLIPRDLQLGNFSTAFIPIRGPIEKSFTDRVILCGDAAGFVHPWTGEGIYYAMASGEIAAKVVSKAIECGEYTRKKLSEYQAIWMEDFGKELKMAAYLQKHTAKFKPFFEIAIQIAATNNRLTKIYADVVQGRISLTETKMGKLFSRLST
jgi:geranylgeranyl reductase family protein